MAVGYIARYISAKSPLELGPYIIQSLFIILPPSLYAATIYMIYGRIVIFVNSPDASMIRPNRVTKIFVCGDVVSFFMQAGGGGMMAQANMAKLGQKIMLLGLFAQLLMFSFFLTIALVFWKRMQSSAKLYTVPQHGKHTWKSMMKLLFSAATVIILRCIYRIIEFAQGNDGYLASHEIFMYILDAVPMLFVQIMFHFVHAGDVFPADFVTSKLQDNGSFVNLREGLRGSGDFR
ncbi:hypothetical protein VI817_008851 [Penicillium citrinum]|nr:hypothetical protein VI817_008851 [Penicillium citrinum]